MDILESITILNGSVEVYSWLIIGLAVLYVILTFNRHKPRFGNISVWVGFYPTLVHEFGHIVVCKLLFGKVYDVVLKYTYRGVRETGVMGVVTFAHRNRLFEAIATYFGYVFPPLFVLLGLWLNSIGLFSIYLVINLIMVIYFVFKTSHVATTVMSFILAGVLVYFREYLNLDIIYVVLFNISLGFLLGEVLFSFKNMIEIYIYGSDGWDGRLIRNAIYIPITLTILSWFVLIGYLVYQSMGYMF